MSKRYSWIYNNISCLQSFSPLSISSINITGLNDYFFKNNLILHLHTPQVSFPRNPEWDNLAFTDFQCVLVRMALSKLSGVCPTSASLPATAHVLFSVHPSCAPTALGTMRTGSIQLESHRHGRDVRHHLSQLVLRSPCFNSPAKSLPCGHRLMLQCLPRQWTCCVPRQPGRF